MEGTNMKSAIFTYKLLLKKEWKKEESADDIQNRKMKLSLKNDLTVSCEMLEQGYQLTDIMDCLRKHSYYATHTADKKSITAYMDNVLAKINHEQIRRSGNAYPEAKKAYLLKVENLINKYENYSKASFSDYHEGSIILGMLIHDKFNPEVIKKVIEENSISSNRSKDYAEYMIGSCQKIQQLYSSIAAANNAKLSTEGDIYRFFAKEYMQKTNTDILNARDEIHIINKICQKLITRYEQKIPEGTLPVVNTNILDTQIKPFLIRALNEASPVAIEPGRDKDFYIASILGELELKYEMKKTSGNKYAITEDMYKEINNKYTKKADNGNYYSIQDTLIAKELLEENQDEKSIVRAIAENSTGVLKNDGDKKEMPYNYAQNIIKLAKEALAAEREIFYFETKKLPKTESYLDLVNEGLSAAELYLQTMKERILEYPSFLRKMSQEFADEDAIEKLLNKYPDFDRAALKDAVKEHSPRAALLDNSNTYIEKLFLHVNERLNANIQQNENNENLKKQFNRLRGLAAEGVNIDNAMDKYKDGRVALRMLQKNINKEDIKRVLISMSQTTYAVAPITYANEIIEQAITVNDRINAIKNYEPPNENDIVQIKDLYMTEIQRLYRKKEFIQTDMDVEVVKNMILEHDCTNNDIEYALNEYSPIAAEPGRDEHYVDYIRELAEKTIEQEENRLQMYKVIPRLEHSVSAKEEYNFHYKKLMENIKLPYREIMDVLIAAAMMTQGFKEKEIKEAMLESPLNQDKNIKYGKNIIKEAAHYINENEQQQENTFVRTLTTTVTTTTITKETTE